MNKAIRVFSIAFALLVIFLIVSNPSQEAFLTRIAEDYSTIHHHSDMKKSELLKIGSGKRTNYGILSFYDYKFGSIYVTYMGVAGSVYYLGSGTSNSNPLEEQDAFS